MRRLAICIVFLYLCVFCTHRLQAQDNFYEQEPRVFNGGLLAGANFTQIDGDSYYGYNKVGFTAGGVVYVHFSQIVGASMELLYSQKGSRGEDVVGSPTIGTYVTKYFMNVNYVEVPLTVHLRSYGWDFEAGASFAYLVHSHEWILADVPVTIDPVANRFNSTDVDYVFGLARRLYKQLYASARFQYSITSIRPADRIPVGYGYGNQGQFNNMFSARLMYLF